MEDEKYRTDYCYTRADVDDMLLESKVELARLREENKRFRNNNSKLRNWVNYISQNAHYKHTRLDDFGCEAADTARAALNAEQGETNDR